MYQPDFLPGKARDQRCCAEDMKFMAVQAELRFKYFSALRTKLNNS